MRLYILLLLTVYINTNIYSQIKPKITTNQISNLLVDSTRLENDSILVYYQNGIVIGRDTISGTGGSVGGVTGSGTTNEIAYFTGATTLGSLATSTYPSLTELSYVKGVTSAIQTQLNGKQATLTNPVTGSGTTNYLPKFTGSSALSNSIISDNGSTAFVGGNLNFPNSNELQWKDGGGTSYNVLYMYSDNNVYLSAPVTSSNLIFRRGGYAESMRLDASGNLGLGTSSPSYKLEVYDSGVDAVALFNSDNANGSHIRLAASGTVKSYIGSAAGFITSGGVDDLGLRAVGAIRFATNGAGTDMILDASGNLGLGVTPSAWRNIFNAFQVGYTGSLYSIATGTAVEQVNLASNYYQNSAGSELRIQAGYATRYQQASGQHIWSNAGTSTANSAISFTQAMTLDANGRLGIGTTTPTSKLQVNGNTNITGKLLLNDATSSIYVGSNNATTATTAYSNLGVGNNALLSLTTGDDNIAIGTDASYTLTTGIQNISIGKGAATGATSSINNIAIGNLALNVSNGESNVGIGTLALGSATTGNNNIAIGHSAGQNHSSATESIYIGKSTTGTTSATNEVVIGSNAAGQGTNTTVINSTSTVRTTIQGDTLVVPKFLNVDTSTLYVDATNNRVGINTIPGAFIDFHVLAQTARFSQTDPTKNISFDVFHSNNNDFTSTTFRNYGRSASGTLFGQSIAGHAFLWHSSQITASNFTIGTLGNSDFIIGTNDAERMRFKGNGDLKLDPSTSGPQPGVEISWNSADSTIYFSTSSIRFKENIRDYDKGISTLMQMKPVYFNYKTSPQLEAGFIAEDIESIELDEYITKDGEGLVFGLRVGAFKPLIVKAIQEQQVIIEQQKAEIETLKNQYNDLLQRIINLENN